MLFVYDLAGYSAQESKTFEPISSVSFCLADRILEQLRRAIENVW